MDARPTRSWTLSLRRSERNMRAGNMPVGRAFAEFFLKLVRVKLTTKRQYDKIPFFYLLFETLKRAIFAFRLNI
jgi:hypothetical protein